MSYYSRNMPTVATYFSPAGQDGFGDLAYSSGQEVRVRWQVKNELIKDAQGRQVVSKAVVYVNDLVKVGGRLALGTATSATDGEEILAVGVSPSLNTQQDLVKIWL